MHFSEGRVGQTKIEFVCNLNRNLLKMGGAIKSILCGEKLQSYME